MITPIRSRYQSVVELAKNLDFVLHRVPGTYYIGFSGFRVESASLQNSRANVEFE